MPLFFEDILIKFARKFEKFYETLYEAVIFRQFSSMHRQQQDVKFQKCWYFEKWCVGDILYLYSDCVSYFEPRRSSAARVQICNVQHQLPKFERWALSKFRVQNQTDLVTPSAMSVNYGNSVEAELSISRQLIGADSLEDVRFAVHHWLHYMIFSWQVLRFFCHNY